MLNTVIIQPPLVQLNTPYPSGAYLRAFFTALYEETKTEGAVEWLDLSNALFHRIFCRAGLEFIFKKTAPIALQKADFFERNGDDSSAFQLRRFVSSAENWCRWIDTVIAIVCRSKNVSGREFVHEFVRSAHSPRGNRMEQYLSGLNRDVTADDSQILASLALADLADYISVVYDESFSLIRYAEHLAVSTADFSQAAAGLSSPVLNDFYKPLLQEKLRPFLGGRALFCISIPFPGTFEAALFTAKEIRAQFGNKAIVSFGGGYVNTELRTVKETGLFDFCDILSYDKGYGSYVDFFENDCALNGKQLYKIKYRFNGSVIEPLHHSERLEMREKSYIKKIIPDFSGIDFDLYPRLADDTNPMHRIWNDGAWLKAYMAYGCYWHRCAFCDTSLDYVKGYCSTDISALYDGLHNQAEKTGVYGIHFVDEACPPAGMQLFALKNCAVSLTGAEKKRLTWWGNIRFEKTFSRDMADLLSYGGLTAVSGGIEIATGNGLNSVNKGTSLEHIVSACCAFKEAGILVHSYMIFGFWNQTEQDLIDSMETLRQLFEAGLLDSAFWHKFSLTLHSTVYREWTEGKHTDLKPLPLKKGQFAENALSFAGENRSEKYAESLNFALDCWMHGEKLKKKVETYFPFKMPSPSVTADYVERLIALYEKKRDAAFTTVPDSRAKFVWIGGTPVVLPAKNGFRLCWSYMGELLYAEPESGADCRKADFVVSFLKKISAERFSDSSEAFSAATVLSSLGKALFFQLRGKGLCALL